ncbi:MAG: glycosyltransferase family 2 protein [Selenomonadaceae bacterium]|nr:glycosyltransferase family 2 protein [Selenomonadaceae bacterium]
MSEILYVVVPCYNEEEVLKETADRLEKKFSSLISAEKISEKSRIVFVNDGSKDITWEIICGLHEKNKIFSGINLSRNRGHQNALLAGLMTVKNFADIVISMDADLQDDINAVDEMIEKYKLGFDIVYGVRSKRDTDTFFKKFTAESFYKLINFLGGDIVENHADYRLMSRRALDGLEKFGEVNLFLRGIIPMIGYPSTIVYYERAERFAGESKYPLKKMLFFAFQGITSLTVEPIRMITSLGFLISLISFLVIVWIFYKHFTGETVIGWSSILVSVWFLGGLVLLSVGVVGEYIGKIYLETKKRPRFIVSEFLNTL